MLKEIIFNGSPKFGIQKIYKFKNGFGASVVCHKYSYGGESGLWELAVLDESGCLTSDTSITDDVLGGLTEKELSGYLKGTLQDGSRDYRNETRINDFIVDKFIGIQLLCDHRFELTLK